MIEQANDSQPEESLRDGAVGLTSFSTTYTADDSAPLINITHPGAAGRGIVNEMATATEVRAGYESGRGYVEITPPLEEGEDINNRIDRLNAQNYEINEQVSALYNQLDIRERRDNPERYIVRRTADWGRVNDTDFYPGAYIPERPVPKNVKWL